MLISKDSALVDRTERDACYEAIAREYGGALQRLADAYEANPEQRRDLLQEIHVAIWRSLAAFQHQCSLRTWTYRVAHNTAMAHITRDRRRATEHLYTLEEISDMVDPHDTEAITGRQLVADRLTVLISRLQVLDRQIFLLYLEDMDATSIAAIAGITPGNVATKVHRIKTLLVRQFHATETDHE
jgi:RNA polymerase sigma-70 factor (ECF subfamily)